MSIEIHSKINELFFVSHFIFLYHLSEWTSFLMPSIIRSYSFFVAYID